MTQNQEKMEETLNKLKEYESVIILLKSQITKKESH